MSKMKCFNVLMAIVSGAALSMGCAAEQGDADQMLSGDSVTAPLALTATYSTAEGLRFASEADARNWSEVAPGVWRHSSGQQQLVIGQQGHQSLAQQLEAELAAQYRLGGDELALQQKEGLLLMAQEAVSNAVSTTATCDVGLYTGPSSPITGVVGAAALAQLSCIDGTVTFTVQSQACTNSTGCSAVSNQTAVADATPRLWGIARNGTGTSCTGTVTVTPPGVTQNSTFTCN